MKCINKVLLINPPTGKYMRDDRCQAPVVSMTAQPPRAPMDLAYMAAMLESAGVECKIRDYPFESAQWCDFEQDLKLFKPDCLIISTTTPTLDFDMKACSIAKQAGRNILTVAKGAHITEHSEEVLQSYSDLDIAIWGECEFAARELAVQEPGGIRGISYRDGARIVKNGERPRLEDLDRLPLPARHLLNNDLYRTPDTNRPIAYILTGRGCPHRCIYCAVSVASGYRLHIRSVDSVVAEIEQCYRQFGIRDFFFRSDTFTWSEAWVVSLCRSIIDKKIKIRWGTNSRVDTISEERLRWMKKAGCYVVGFGVESGNQDMLDRMKKKATLRQAENAVQLCRQFGIKTYTLFLFGLPWETRESAEETIRFAVKLNGDFADFNIAYPLPGTEYFDIAKKEALFEGSLTGFDYGNPVVKSHALSTQDLIDIRKRAIKAFYFRPGYMLKTLLSIRSPKVLCSYARQGCGLAFKMLTGRA